VVFYPILRGFRSLKPDFKYFWPEKKSLYDENKSVCKKYLPCIFNNIHFDVVKLLWRNEYPFGESNGKTIKGNLV
jgi:hypothetical protein